MQPIYKAVSVIIPTWNRASELSLAISSALIQTVPPLEVLVCDDGSTDASEAMVRSFNDPRVKWLPGHRAGRPAVPRNRGLAASCGEWIAFLDSDDRWVSNNLEKQLKTAEAQACRAVCSNALREYPNRTQAGQVVSWPKAKIAFKDLLKANCVVCSSVVIHRSLLTSVSGFPEEERLSACEDYALWLRISTQTDFAFVPQSLVIYRDSPATSIRNVNPDAGVVRKNVLKDFIAWAKSTNQSREYEKKARRALALLPLSRALIGWRCAVVRAANSARKA